MMMDGRVVLSASRCDSGAHVPKEIPRWICNWYTSCEQVQCIALQHTVQQLRSNNAHHFIQKFPISVDMKPAEIHS